MFWGIFFENLFCPVFHGGSSLRNVFENFSKFKRRPKSFPKASKRVLNMFWGVSFENFFPSVPRRVESSKCFQKIKKVPKFQKCPKSFPKKSKHVFNMFWWNFFENFFAQCSMEGRVFEMFLKNFQNSKNAQNRSQIVQRVLNMFWCNFFENVFCPVFHGGSSLRNVFKKSRNFQNSKNAQNRSQKCPNVFWTCLGVIFSKKFLPSVPWSVESSKCF